MSPVMQAMGWRIVHTGVRPHVYEHSKTAVQVHWEGVPVVVFTATCVCSVAVILAAVRAGVHGWLQLQPLGPPFRSRSSLPQSSTATYECCPRSTEDLDSHGDDFRKTYPYSPPRLCASCLSGFVGGGIELTYASSVCSRQREQTIRRGCNRCSSSV